MNTFSHSGSVFFFWCLDDVDAFFNAFKRSHLHSFKLCSCFKFVSYRVGNFLTSLPRAELRLCRTLISSVPQQPPDVMIQVVYSGNSLALCLKAHPFLVLFAGAMQRNSVLSSLPFLSVGEMRAVEL